MCEMEQSARDSVDTGKFASGEELLKAYNALEGEFTRKSQAFSKLVKENEQLKDAAAVFERAKQALSSVGETDFVGSNLPEAIVKLAQNAKTVSDKGRVPEAIKEEIIRDYLEDIFNRSVPPVMGAGGGFMPVNTPKKPKTLDDAAAFLKQSV